MINCFFINYSHSSFDFFYVRLVSWIARFKTEKNLKRTPHTRRERKDEKEIMKLKNYAIERQREMKNVRNEMLEKLLLLKKFFFSLKAQRMQMSAASSLKTSFFLDH